MRYGFAFLTTLAWALWLGGLMTLFLLVSHLFSADRATAVVAAPRMFLAFERYQILLAAVALIATVAWRLTDQRGLITTLFVMFAVASVGAIVSASVITPKMEALRQAGQSSSPAFRALHGQSMIVFSLEAVALLIAGGFLMVATSTFAYVKPKRVDTSAQASTPPAATADPPLSP